MGSNSVAYHDKMSIKLSHINNGIDYRMGPIKLDDQSQQFGLDR